MQKKTGVHFYINIANFDDVAEKEEAATQEVKHSIHELDTFFSSVTSCANLYTTADGKDLFTEVFALLEYASKENVSVFAG